MSPHRIPKLILAAAFVAVALPGVPLRSQQKMDSLNQDRARGMVRDAYDNVKKRLLHFQGAARNRRRVQSPSR
jgi:hypothetical protein